MNEQESIQCSCFNHPIKTSTSGLRPSKLVLSQQSAFLKNPQEVQSQAYVGQLDTSKIKKSLKRSKPQIGANVVVAKSPTFPVAPSFQNSNANYGLFTLRQTIVRNPTVKYNEHVVNFGQQRVMNVNRQWFGSQRSEGVGMRQENRNAQVMLSNCNTVSMSTAQQTPKITIKYQTQPSIPSNEGSQFQIASQQIIFKVEQFHTQDPTAKSRKSSTSTQRRYKTANSHQPLKMVLKEIESLVDENDFNDDLSEVIGRGWDRDEDSFELIKNRQLAKESQTHPTSASNIKNSSLESGFGGQSHLQNFY